MNINQSNKGYLQIRSTIFHIAGKFIFWRLTSIIVEMRVLIVFLVGAIMPAIASADLSTKNVLFLVADDMRPDIGVYNENDQTHQKMYTPNLDKLAKQSLLLKRAYVQQAVCSPTRASLLTSRRPDTTHVHDLIQYWREVGGNFTTIPQYFKENGYMTAGMGKIFHPGGASGHDDPISWTEPYFHGKAPHWKNASRYSWYAASEEETKQFPLLDDQTAEHAVEMLNMLASEARNGQQPFFLAVGFHKPHLPFLFPEQFLKHYPINDIQTPDNPYAPIGMPQVAWSNFDEIRKYDDIMNNYGYGDINGTQFPDTVVKQLRRAYYSAISYTDSLVGKVVDTLENLGLASNTIISFWGDHGWQLGEHGEWCKHTNFELATHAPMMVKVPGMTDHGVVTETPTEFVDLFPTLVEAAGLPKLPLCPENSSNVTTCTEGISMIPLIEDPEREWKSAVFSQYPRMIVSGNVVMGYTLRAEVYRYTEWVFYDTVKYEPIWDQTRGFELYDHSDDPQENINRIDDPNYNDIKKKLSKVLHDGWRAAIPEEKHKNDADINIEIIS